MRDLIESLRGSGRRDLSGLPTGAGAHLLAEATEGLGPMVVIAPDADAAVRFADDLRFFVRGRGRVLHLPALDTTPYLDVAPDRRAAMDRMRMGRPLRSSVRCSVVVPGCDRTTLSSRGT